MVKTTRKLSTLGSLLRTLSQIPGLDFLKNFAKEASDTGATLSNVENRVTGVKSQVKHSQKQVDKLKE